MLIDVDDVSRIRSSERQPLCGVVLCGGSSKRMGVAKASLMLGSETLLQRAVRRMGRVFPKVLVAGASECVIGSAPIPDLLPAMGPLGGIHAALVRGYTCAVVACDMPFFSPEFLLHMAQIAPEADVVVPKIGEFYEPLHAIYRQSCAPHIEQMAKQAGGRSRRPGVRHLYPRVRVRLVGAHKVKEFGDPDILFLNVNGPEELETARQLLKQRARQP